MNKVLSYTDKLFTFLLFSTFVYIKYKEREIKKERKKERKHECFSAPWSLDLSPPFKRRQHYSVHLLQVPSTNQPSFLVAHLQLSPPCNPVTHTHKDTDIQSDREKNFWTISIFFYIYIYFSLVLSFIKSLCL